MAKTFITLGIIGLVGLPGGASLAAGEQRYISVYVDGKSVNSMTTARTVGEALERMSISLDSADVIEPSLDTEINLASFSVNVYRSRLVKIIDGEDEIVVKSAYWNPRLIADQAGLKTYPEDKFEIYTEDDYIAQSFVGEVVVLDRALPMRIELDGQTLDVRTHKSTIGQVLEEQGIKLGKEDFTSPDINEAAVDHFNVKVVRVGHEVETVEERIAFETNYVTDHNLPIGVTKTEREGSNGRIVKSFEITRHNGRVIDKELDSEVVALEAVNKVVLVGSSNNGRVYCETQGNWKNVNLVNAGLGHGLAEDRGWSGEQWSALLELWACESSWTHTVSNYAGSGAYGIPQSLPAKKMASHGEDYLTNPVTQIRWGLDYIERRYGNPIKALDFHHANNWY